MGLGPAILAHPQDAQIVQVLTACADRVGPTLAGTLPSRPGSADAFKVTSRTTTGTAFEISSCSSLSPNKDGDAPASTGSIHLISATIDELLNFRGNTAQLVAHTRSQLAEIADAPEIGTTSTSQSIMLGYYDLQDGKLVKRHVHCAIDDKKDLIVIHSEGDPLAEAFKSRSIAGIDNNSKTEPITRALRDLFSLWREVVQDFSLISPRTLFRVIADQRISTHSYHLGDDSLATEISAVFIGIQGGLKETALQFGTLLSDLELRRLGLHSSDLLELREDVLRFCNQAFEIPETYGDGLNKMLAQDMQSTQVAIDHGQNFFQYALGAGGIGMAFGSVLVSVGKVGFGIASTIGGVAVGAALLIYGRVKKWQGLNR